MEQEQANRLQRIRGRRLNTLRPPRRRPPGFSSARYWMITPLPDEAGLM
jgi:hypothetical protein